MKCVQVLGPGCPTCDEFARNAQAAVERMGIEATVEKITEIDRILEFDVLVTPALAVDGEVRAVGKVLTAEEIEELLV